MLEGELANPSHHNVQAGIEFLAGKHVAKFLSELLELKVHIVDPRNGATGYELALLTHVSWLIDFDTGARELSTLRIVESVRTTAFQRIYNQGDVPAAVEFGRVATAPVNTLRQQTHRCQEISVCF